MKYPDITMNDNDIIEYNRKVLPRVKDLEPTYSIIARARSHDIKGGDNIDIDIYLTGQGIPEANKLVLLWSSHNIIDVSSPGVATYCIEQVTKKLNSKVMAVPVAGKNYITHRELDPNGLALFLSRGYFLPAPKQENIDLPLIMGERCHSGYHPISISLKTLRKAKSGDYEIDVNLTYTYKNITKQGSNKVKFHITSWWDRNGARVITAGTIIAFILLVLTFLNVWGFIGS